MNQSSAIEWPTKQNVLGVLVTPTCYREACDVILQAAHAGESAVVSLHAVHALVTAVQDQDLLRKVNTFEMIAPDGQPVRWALNMLHGSKLKDRVYGPELTIRLCERAAQESVPVYFYGSTPEVLEQLVANLATKYHGLKIVGAESPPFRKLTEEERDAMVAKINASGAGLVFIGLGAPKQDHFAFDHSHLIRAVQVCVGAAFDFHAGNKKIAPGWMQRRGLEWLFRLCQEPRRLWKRYLVTNTVFTCLFVRQLIGVAWKRLFGTKTERKSPPKTSTTAASN